MMSTLRRLILFGVLAAASVGAAIGFGTTGGQPPVAAPGADRQADRDAIKAMVAQFKEAFQKGDAAACAVFMTSEAEIIPDEGDTLKGRDAIQKAYAAHFAKSERSKISLKPEELRFPSRDTAIEEGEMTVTPSDGSPSTHKYHILYVREDGKWFISIIKEWPVETTDLDDLDWLIGTWRAKTGDVEVTNTYEWMSNKSFIKASISVRGKDRSFTAMQIIGVDPAGGDIRTWTFEQDGGLGEGTITHDGPRWVFENLCTMAGGATLECTNILIPVDRDTITWQPTNLTINGDSIGNLAPTKLTRVRK